MEAFYASLAPQLAAHFAAATANGAVASPSALEAVDEAVAATSPAAAGGAVEIPTEVNPADVTKAALVAPSNNLLRAAIDAYNAPAALITLSPPTQSPAATDMIHCPTSEPPMQHRFFTKFAAIKRDGAHAPAVAKIANILEDKDVAAHGHLAAAGPAHPVGVIPYTFSGAKLTAAEDFVVAALADSALLGNLEAKAPATDEGPTPSEDQAVDNQPAPNDFAVAAPADASTYATVPTILDATSADNPAAAINAVHPAEVEVAANIAPAHAVALPNDAAADGENTIVWVFCGNLAAERHFVVNCNQARLLAGAANPGAPLHTLCQPLAHGASLQAPAQPLDAVSFGAAHPAYKTSNNADGAEGVITDAAPSTSAFLGPGLTDANEAACPFPCRLAANTDDDDGDTTIMEDFLRNLEADDPVAAEAPHQPNQTLGAPYLLALSAAKAVTFVASGSPRPISLFEALPALLPTQRAGPIESISEAYPTTVPLSPERLLHFLSSQIPLAHSIFGAHWFPNTHAMHFSLVYALFDTGGAVPAGQHAEAHFMPLLEVHTHPHYQLLPSNTHISLSELLTILHDNLLQTACLIALMLPIFLLYHGMASPLSSTSTLIMMISCFHFACGGKYAMFKLV
ncbi:hypothetical protein L7F22_004307 [Adiantum nelumboides]|nr:hypothetical protein [Adiantum nelumboides]